MQLQCISMTAPIEEKEALPPTKECKNLNDKDENDGSRSIHGSDPSGLSKNITLTPQSLSPQMNSAYNASQDLKERAQDWVEARSPNSGTADRAKVLKLCSE
jgi:hypothetical protein